MFEGKRKARIWAEQFSIDGEKVFEMGAHLAGRVEEEMAQSRNIEIDHSEYSVGNCMGAKASTVFCDSFFLSSLVRASMFRSFHIKTCVI